MYIKESNSYYKTNYEITSFLDIQKCLLKRISEKGFLRFLVTWWGAKKLIHHGIFPGFFLRTDILEEIF